MRSFSAAQVHDLLPMADCIEVMIRALREARDPGVENPLRSLVRFPEGNGLLGLMPAVASGSAGIKVVTVMPQNHGTPYDSHQGVVLLFEREHGRLLGIADGSAVTALRTAAVSGAATRYLARPDATVLAILGSGVQAATHVEAMLAVRPVREIRVWSRSAANAERFAKETEVQHKVPVRVCANGETAVHGADLVCTTTGSKDPVLQGAWLAEGAHVNAVGACFPTAREVDTETVVRSAVFVDRMESAVAEAGDLLIPVAEGAWDFDRVQAELGAVFAGEHPGRTNPREITLFKSLGIGLEDLATVEARLERRGTEIDLG